jgi:hypothetical protein
MVRAPAAQKVNFAALAVADWAHRADLRRWAAAINEVHGRHLPGFSPVGERAVDSRT